FLRMAPNDIHCAQRPQAEPGKRLLAEYRQHPALANRRQQFLENKTRIGLRTRPPAEIVRLTCRPILHLSVRARMDTHTNQWMDEVPLIQIVQHTFQSHPVEILSVVDKQQAHILPALRFHRQEKIRRYRTAQAKRWYEQAFPSCSLFNRHSVKNSIFNLIWIWGKNITAGIRRSSAAISKCSFSVIPAIRSSSSPLPRAGTIRTKTRASSKPPAGTLKTVK